MLLNASSLAMGCVSLWEMELSVTASFHTFPSHSWDSTLLASCFCLLSMAPVPRTITPFMPYSTFLFCCLLHFLFASAKKLLFSQRFCQYPSLELPDCFTSQQLCTAWVFIFPALGVMTRLICHLVPLSKTWRALISMKKRPFPPGLPGRI